VPVFETRWYASNIVDQGIGFVCLDCATTWKVSPSQAELREASRQGLEEDWQMFTGCFLPITVAAFGGLGIYLAFATYPLTTTCVGFAVLSLFAWRHVVKRRVSKPSITGALQDPEPVNLSASDTALLENETQRQQALSAHLRAYSTERLLTMIEDATLSLGTLQEVRDELARRS
jgi:hypothetical protein